MFFGADKQYQTIETELGWDYRVEFGALNL